MNEKLLRAIVAIDKETAKKLGSLLSYYVPFLYYSEGGMTGRLTDDEIDNVNKAIAILCQNSDKE